METLPLGHPDKPLWGYADIAVYWGVTEKTVREYKARGKLPQEHDKIGRTPVWLPRTIIEYPRPGRGARTDLRDQPLEQDHD
ncbi:hypothetical protein [Spirillospora sp. CA-294931]|uniref:hypothetical protein n=1 Tax=Spirillospora sp. CA-294931 TaxID=3240042 RepID=UPI003D8A613B